MKKIPLFFALVLLSIFFACDGKKAHVDERNELTYIYLDSCDTKITGLKYRFLKLETTNDCLIATINKMYFDDNKIFIKDSNDKIFVFDDSGKFLNTVGSIGQGPDDHFSIYDFYLDKINKTLIRVC